MKTIYRYTINDPSGMNDVVMPNGAEILSTGISCDYEDGKEVISIWAMVDTDETPITRSFIVVGTGTDMDKFNYMNKKFIGTVIKKNQYAFHVFEAI